MRRIWCLAILMATAKIMSAQSTDEISALRFSLATYGNSARTLGTAGAFGAVGADVSASSINPAGWGLFRTSELSFSPAFNVYNSNTTYLNGSGTGQAYNFNVGNWGFVRAIHIKNTKSPWRYVNFGFNTNRLDVYNKQVNFSGNNPNNSYTQYWADLVNSYNNGQGISAADMGASNSPFYASAFMGYEARLIVPNGSNPMQYHTVVTNGQVFQAQQNTITGKLRETNITLAANYSDKVYIGAAIGIPYINYTETKIYNEQNTDASNAQFSNFTLTDAVNTSGWGLNAKLGTIVRVANYLRLGISVQSPTIFTLTDLYSDSIQSHVGDSLYYFTPQDGKYSYTLITPMKGTLSAALLLKGYGFISLDYTYVPYNTIYYNFNQSSDIGDQAIQNQINSSISARYTGASNIRLGTEYAYKDFRVRAGAAYYGSPYNSSYAPANGYDLTSWLFSLGGGIRFNHAYLDIAYAYQMQKSIIQPYVDPTLITPTAFVKSSLNTVMLTLGIKL